MPLVLVKEDGTGLANANSYASVDDGNAYHLGHLYATAWTAATAANQAAGLVMATRIIDVMFNFHGYKCTNSQALQWPRQDCRDPDALPANPLWPLVIGSPYLDATKVPPIVTAATCEFARALLLADRTANPSGEGLKELKLDVLDFKFLPADRQPVAPDLVQKMLSKIAVYLGSPSGAARLVRV